MKKLLFLLLLSSSLLAACDKSESDSSERTELPSGDCFYMTDGSVVEYYYYPDGIFAQQYDGGIFFIFDGYFNNENQVKASKEYASYYGDTTFFEKRYIGDSYRVTANPLASINVTADKDFDSKHPAGSSLNDVISLKYASAYNLIQSGYDPSIDIANRVKKGDYEVMPLSKLDNVKLMYYAFDLLFDKQPDVKGKYTFEITFNFDKDPISGKELKLAPAKVECEF